MKTEVFHNETGTSAEIIRNGGLVAVPTETVYGLAGNGLDADAVRKIYEVKGRPEVKPLSLMVPGAEAMEQYCEDVPQQAYWLADKFWPGPLTIVLKAKDFVPPVVLAGGTTVGLRCPDHTLTLNALREAGVPFAAPSANPSGEPSPKDADTVLQYFDGMIDGVIDGGRCGIGRESTLISLVTNPYRIFRQGALPAEEIADALVEHMTVIGITGQSGAGKTTALSVLQEAGATVIDCDALYHELLMSDSSLQEELKKAFPEATGENGIDRKKLGSLVFQDKKAMQKLNAVTHPVIRNAVRSKLREAAMNGRTAAAVDAAELLAGGLGEFCSVVYGIVADESVRIQRIMERDGISETAAKIRVSAQKSETYYREKCDKLLINNGTFEMFAGKCRAEFSEVLKNG